MKKIRCVLFVVIILCALTACAENKPASPPENSGGNDVKKINPDVYRFAADAIKNKTGADLALIDSDSVNGYFDLTKATEREQLQNVLKSLQNVEKIQLTGAELLEIFEAVSSRYPEDIPAGLYFQGAVLYIGDMEATRKLEVYVAGKILSPEAVYTVAVFEGLTLPDSGYPVLSDVSDRETMGPAMDMVMDFWEECRWLPPAVVADRFEEKVLEPLSKRTDAEGKLAHRKLSAYYTKYEYENLSPAFRNSLLINFPGFENYPVYVLRGITARERPLLAGWFAEAGETYSWEDYIEDARMIGYDPPFQYSQNIFCSDLTDPERL